MDYTVKKMDISYNRSYKALSPQGFVIHSTDTPGATAQNEHDYFNSGNRQASAHYFVDWQEIIQTVPENEQAWHAGPAANSRYLSVEMCEPSDNSIEKFLQVWKRTVWLVADACVRYGWSAQNNIYSHRGISLMYKETNHTDPMQYLERFGETWDSLLEAIDRKITELIKQKGVAKMKNLIITNRGADERAAGYLADYLKAPVVLLDQLTDDTVQGAENIYVVGGSDKPVSSAILISGSNRYETCRKVLDICGNK
ncbi:N-acetylmuramoyl-L-alanine amidase family 2 [Syntrophobotulus glycolicus DSM 8271]|uniref:N-acetylmuramoyl-L-alanine amidase n=1 Tax=Syntrophobotulus glycolicus (strain DSM 8271 / FlGlyR) TaxID=645991 RepID=F0T0Z3_SYNGF|nr:peptidoglycan recognition family protein [Syntrophobotulus glycolicus]ADY57364.1 N-acetylmuramoyl-L-alanine amidase family 2 [Syntrophobotulus glycolicus DSM 8271]